MFSLVIVLNRDFLCTDNNEFGLVITKNKKTQNFSSIHSLKLINKYFIFGSTMNDITPGVCPIPIRTTRIYNDAECE
jgi:hypothetical protein